MRQFVFTLMFMVLAQLAQSQSDTVPVRLSGRVFSTDSLQPAPYVHVINLATGKGSIADSEGVFKILVLPADSLLFKCMGFTDALFLVPMDLPSKMAHFDIKIVPGSIGLQVIDVIALTRQNQFKYDFIHLKPDKNAWENQFIIPGVGRKKYEWICYEEKFNPKKTFDGPISGLYYAFSKDGKSLRKFAELVNFEESQRIIDSKYNIGLLSDFTGYSGDKLIAFFVYLDFSNSYILNTNIYNIYTDISWRITTFETQFNARH